MSLIRDGARLGELTEDEIVRLGEHTEMLGVRDMVRAMGSRSSGEAMLRAEEHGGGLAVFSEAIASPYFNRVFGLGLDGPLDLQLLDRLDAIYRATTAVALVQIHDGENTPAVRERAAKLGWQSAPGWVKMMRDNAPPIEIRTDLRIQRIGPEQAAAMGAITVDAFHMPSETAALAGGLLREPDWHIYGAFDSHALVAVGALAMYGQVGYLAVGATAVSHRNRGAQGTIMARRLRDGAELGAQIFVTETGMETAEQPNPSYHNMLRLGFKLAYHRADYVIG
jgi:hypothetical protein